MIKNKLKAKIKYKEKNLVDSIALDMAFPLRKNSKTERLKAEILNLERQLDLLERGLEDQTYEEYKQEYISQEDTQTEQSKVDEIAELEAKLAALRG